MKSFYINNTKITNQLKYKGSIHTIYKAYGTDIAKNTEIIYSIERDDGIEPLNSLDFLILDAVYLIYNDTRTYDRQFTVNKLIQAITGTPVRSISEKRLEKYTKELEKLMKTRITIDFTNEAMLRNVSDPVENDDEEDEEDALTAIVNRPLLSLEKQEGTNNYRIIKMPPLYLYSKINNQVLSIPHDIFYADSDVKRITDRTMLIKYYLIREITVKKHLSKNHPQNAKKDDANCIYLSLFTKSYRSNICDNGMLTQLDWFPHETENEPDAVKNYCDLSKVISTTTGLHTIKDINKIATRYLDVFKNKGFIKDYEIEKNGKKGAMSGYIIKF